MCSLNLYSITNHCQKRIRRYVVLFSCQNQQTANALKNLVYSPLLPLILIFLLLNILLNKDFLHWKCALDYFFVYIFPTKQLLETYSIKPLRSVCLFCFLFNLRNTLNLGFRHSFLVNYIKLLRQKQIIGNRERNRTSPVPKLQFNTCHCSATGSSHFHHPQLIVRAFMKWRRCAKVEKTL